MKGDRKKTRKIHLGDVAVGGDAPVSVQSMTKTDTRDYRSTLEQLEDLGRAGCEIGRCAVPDEEAAAALAKITAGSPVPIVADIHFKHTLALAALKAGVQGLRINPGNIGSEQKVSQVAAVAADRGVPIRIGVNSGSVENDLLDKFGGPTAEAMVESALRHIAMFEKFGFEDIKISLKAPEIDKTVRAYREISRRVDYPLHLGITEAGTPFSGAVRSAVGLGILLNEGIGDTIRVSLTGDPVEEVKTGFLILQALELREFGPMVISCPTCGRLKGEDMEQMALEIEEGVSGLRAPLKLAVMGCEVNGPGESKEADLGICMGKDFGVLYRKGEMIRKIERKDIVRIFIEEAERLEKEYFDGRS